MVNRVCEQCGKEFKVINSRKNSARFCCKACVDESKKAAANVVCTNCGEAFHMKPFQQNRYSRNHGFFCSRACFAEAKKRLMAGSNNHQYGLKGDLNSSFKGMEVSRKNNKQVDILIHAPNHPYEGNAGRVRNYRLAVETNYEKFDKDFFDYINGSYYLKPKIHVHHIDGNHDNNDIENLIPLTISEHMKTHNKNRILIRDTDGRITAVLKSDKLLENPKEDNQQPIISLND